MVEIRFEGVDNQEDMVQQKASSTLRRRKVWSKALHTAEDVFYSR
jgi:hypothetical protein